MSGELGSQQGARDLAALFRDLWTSRKLGLNRIAVMRNGPAAHGPRVENHPLPMHRSSTSRTVSQEQPPRLPDLMRLGNSATALQVGDLRNPLIVKKVLAAPDSLLDSRTQQQSPQSGEADVCVRLSAEYGSCQPPVAPPGYLP